MEKSDYSILVVDDEEKIRSIIRKYAEFEGYRISEAANGLEAIAMVKENDYDLIILDIMMPELDGFSTCREVKKTKDVPVIMLSARGEEYDRIHGFELGVDDYVIKPFSPQELLMRANVIISRHKSLAESVDFFISAGLTIDFISRLVYVDGQRVIISPKTYDLLFYMIKNRHIALSRERLITAVWGYDFIGDERTLDTHIKLLRTAMGPYRDYISTIRGVGYRFDDSKG